MSRNESDNIKKIVDHNGWKEVRRHPVYGPIWKKAMDDQKRFEAKL